jgi:hypothetical protein
MNELIFELAKQADLIQWDTLPSGARTPDYESVVKAKKFAELIVRECIAQCWAVSELESKGYVVSECSKKIRKHFGVE